MPRRSGVAFDRPHKYGAKAVVIDNIRFASTKEARRYMELQILVKAGEITHLVPHPRFDLWAATPLENGHRNIVKVGVYVADFQYREQASFGETVIEDVKGMKTPMYRLKKKLFEACYGLRITEI